MMKTVVKIITMLLVFSSTAHSEIVTQTLSSGPGGTVSAHVGLTDAGDIPVITSIGGSFKSRDGNGGGVTLHDVPGGGGATISGTTGGVGVNITGANSSAGQFVSGQITIDF